MLVLTAACGASAPPPGNYPRPAIATGFGRADVLERWMGERVTLGGLSFADPACAEFSPPQEVTPPRTKALARCLAGLPLVQSERRDALADVSILTYAPGFEIEARMIADASGAHLTWIGFEAERDARDTTPTISGRALEALRTAGTGEFAEGMAWFKVCLDPTGNIARAEPRLVSSIAARDAGLAAINGWQFQPFVVAGAPRGACAMTRLTAASDPSPEVLPYPAPASEPGEEDPLLLVAGALVHVTGNDRILPDPPDQDVPGLAGTFRICIDRKGNVSSVFPVNATGLRDYDRKIELVVRGWTYRPLRDANGPIAACTIQTFPRS